MLGAQKVRLKDGSGNGDSRIRDVQWWRIVRRQ